MLTFPQSSVLNANVNSEFSRVGEQFRHSVCGPFHSYILGYQ